MYKTAAVLACFLILPAAVQAAVNIQAGPTKHMVCSAGVCTPTAKNSALSTSDLAAMLATSDVTVKTGAGAVTIEVTAPLAWAGAHTLTLDANLNVSIKAQVVVQGVGGLAVVTNDGGSGGDLKFFPSGKVDFWDTGASFSLNHQDHVLVNDIASMATAYAGNRYAVLALAKDYDAGADGIYPSSAVKTPMDGTFEGLGHTISNFHAAGDDRLIGLFSQTLSTFSVIRDLTLSGVHIAGGTESLAGGLEGANAGAIVGVHSSGTVSALNGSDVGGLVGSGGVFTRSDSSAAVECASSCHAGGLVGFGGTFLLSHASGTVTVGATSAGGGLTGLLGASKIVQSYATGDVIAAQQKLSNVLGGLVGDAIQNSQVIDSYALGAVGYANESSLGGLLGGGEDNIVKNAYAIGAVGASTPHRRLSGTGGFIGVAQFIDDGDYANLYWDVDTSGMTDGCGAARPRRGCPKIKGLSDAQLKSALPAGFDPAIWGRGPAINNGYPYLLNNPPG